MSCKLISGTQPCCHLSPKPLQSTTTKSNLHLSFNTHLSKSNISIKTSSYRTTTKAAVNSLYATTETTESFYELLGIPESGTLPEIKRAYKQLALKYHPDVSPAECTEEYTRTFIRVQEAYETLSDPKSRALYDMGMSKTKGVRKQRGDWMNLWQSQLMELKQRSVMKKNSRGNNNMSWGDRIRMQRNEASC